ncbi:BglG family transcription antiterminator [Faecalicatena sp. AGMB00832]|uniref:BglG family transcription antiterminator n=1 Tax=Faecalicatena faecalis TaxID=2726362 RepID=A0ABS6D2F8_9FIRM|nr:BglG family transcription antiterminator [Faecalicatena faecalis]MBU3875382.1 BglG family transcription antiterminator [Faecalicatena faecalis]
MNQRTISIIQELCKSEKGVTISHLAEEFQVSHRTIRNDLNTVNEMLQEHELPELVLEKGGEIVREDSFKELLPFIAEKSFYEYKLSKEERKRIAAALLVSSSEFITLSSIAENLFVSRATIINDLDAIKAFVKQGNLEVVSHPNKGLRVDGKESDKRLFLMRLSSFSADQSHQDMVSRHISVQAGNRIIIQKILSEQEHFHKSFLTDDSFAKVLLYLGIMTNRNRQGEYIEVRKKSENSKYSMARDILKYISQYCQINSTEDEVQFLSEILAMAKYIKQKSFNKNAIKIQMITRQFIEHISEELGINLNSDYDFFENLSNHLESVFTLNPPTYPENPVIDEVLEENHEIVAAVHKMIYIIRQYVNREIQEIEIGYIAVHVCAAIERKKNKEVAFHVIVACHGGIGTSRLLLERLKKHFNFQIVDIISSHEAANLPAQAADFIISTVPLKECKLDYVTVSPLLSDEDYIRVGNKIDALRNSRNLPSRIENKEITAKGLIEKIAPVIYNTVPENADGLMKKLKKVVREYFRQPIETEAEIFAPYLHHLLPASHIQLDIECEDWRQAVSKSAEKLLQCGYIEERYIDAMIANIEENGPYIVISKGFAVPHEGLEQGSIKVGMNLIRLKNPVTFGDEELDPVEFVCCLSAVDHKTHLKAFFNLVNMLKTEAFKKQLHECKTSEEAALLIERFEYEVVE